MTNEQKQALSDQARDLASRSPKVKVAEACSGFAEAVSGETTDAGVVDAFSEFIERLGSV